jgi:sugar/nucleoside kinase (ribokinase family)
MLVAFTVILDDIVFPDGRTAMGVLGGGGPQAAFGMRLFADQVGLVGVIGADLPAAVWDWLRDSGIDSQGLAMRGEATPRAWQVTENDGRRTQVWRVKPPGSAPLPAGYTGAAGYHLGRHPESPDLPGLADLRRQGLLSLELFRPASQPLAPANLMNLLSAADIFSVNLEEAHSLVGGGSLRGVARKLVEAAESRSRLLVLRLGAQGSLAIQGQTGQAVRIPAGPATVVDVVGAGNAYCGAFLAGWTETHDLAWAGCCGAAAAALTVAQVGLPVVTPGLRIEARQRASQLLNEVDSTPL